MEMGWVPCLSACCIVYECSGVDWLTLATLKGTLREGASDTLCDQ